MNASFLHDNVFDVPPNIGAAHHIDDRTNLGGSIGPNLTGKKALLFEGSPSVEKKSKRKIIK
jgi:hypothetical protein